MTRRAPSWGLLLALLGAGPGCEEPAVEPDLRAHIEGLGVITTL